MSDTLNRAYKTAIGHYLSPKRQDSVKAYWEGPFSREITKQALNTIASENDGKSISIIDFGCGIGEGLTLLHQAFKGLGIDKAKAIYTGIDISPEMIDTATAIWQNESNINFVCQDFRATIPASPTHIYYSCGAPYSHLTPGEMIEVLGHIFRRIKQNQTKSLILIDVLGRYSLEWTSKWEENRWAYRMSFLAEASEEQEPIMMTCYYAPDLLHMFQQVAQQTGCEIISASFYDRSITVGRHTTTRDYNPHLRPYRSLVNSLYHPQQKTDLKELLLNSPLPQAPEPIQTFFSQFANEWNALVATATYLRQGSGFPGIETNTARAKALQSAIQSQAFKIADTFSDELELVLAEHLRQLEISMNPGLGIGHTLIGVLQVKGDLD